MLPPSHLAGWHSLDKFEQRRALDQFDQLLELEAQARLIRLKLHRALTRGRLRAWRGKTQLAETKSIQSIGD